MTAPLFLIGSDRLAGASAGSRVLLDGAEGRHAATVRRLQPGEPVLLSDGAGLLGRGTVRVTDAGQLEVTLTGLESVPPATPGLVLVQALAKGGRDELAVQAATELGVDEVWPWQADRSVVRWTGERGERSRQRWVSCVREAAKQARRPRIPVVGPALSSAALADRIASTAGAALVLDPAGPEALADVGLPAQGQLLVLVGPEGGVADDELAALTAAGGRSVRLGPQVLRSSTAGPAALAVLAARLGRWSSAGGPRPGDRVGGHEP